MEYLNPTCQVCGQGELKRKKKYRMSGPVVFIGYIFLIPSILGMLFGILMMFTTGSTTSSRSELNQKVISDQLATVDIPEEIIEKVISREPLTEDDQNQLNDEQNRFISHVRSADSIGQFSAGAATVLVGGISLFIIIFSFIGGLLGWLLVMKKRVLQCVRCDAVIAAS